MSEDGPSVFLGISSRQTPSGGLRYPVLRAAQRACMQVGGWGAGRRKTVLGATW